MNISQPVTSQLDEVDFTVLSASEIRALSVRRIDNENTFDSLLNPVPGGLYDPALGAWGDSICTTCYLGSSSCPGHPGHIDLAVPVYHPEFMNQTFRLLKAQCRFCWRFRLARQAVHRYTCKLRLIQYGMLHEASMIDALGEDFAGLAVDGVPTAEGADSDSDNDGPNGGADGVMRARDDYVRRILAQKPVRTAALRHGKHEGALQARRDVVKEFLAEITRGRLCSHCQGISYTYRKDRFVKIFEKDLAPKEKAAMKQRNFKARDALFVTHKQSQQPQDGGYVSDEAVADMSWEPGGGGGWDVERDVDEETEDEEEDDEEEEGDGDRLDEAGELAADSLQGSPGPVRMPSRPQLRKRVPPTTQRYLSALEVLARLNLLFEREQEILSLLYSSRPLQKSGGPVTADMLFLNALLVPPNRYRPDNRTGDSQVTEAQQNNLYKSIIRSSAKVARVWTELRDAQGATGSDNAAADSGRRSRDMVSMHEACTELQECVNSLVDRNKNPVRGSAARRNEDGVKQKLEKKEGLFRRNMMGKRVNYAARSVISPDPNIETNEIGVPPVFARKLTYPEPVTHHNFRDMQEAVIRGVGDWPGASAIENENGQVINLRGKSREERVSLANQLLTPSTTTTNSGSGYGSSNFGGLRNKKVHRHLTNGDVVLMNRQPTLHKPSIMGHRVRVLPGEKTIRMHYANCNTYNADFDGDEMNMHFPQNEVARAEALQLADTDHQYVSGTQGKPLRGLIQDHLSVSVALCSRDTFFDRATYHQLVYSALRPESGHVSGGRIRVVPPAVLKPVARWTGKQVITTLLENMRPPSYGTLWMDGRTQIGGHAWGTAGSEEEGLVCFRDGEFLTGILDKSQLGPSSGGLVHAVHEVYGPAVASRFLSSMGRLLTRHLAVRAFSCGMDDLRLTADGEVARGRELDAAPRMGLEVAANYVGLGGDNTAAQADSALLLQRLEEAMRDDSKQEGLDLLMTKAGGGVSSAVTKACLPVGLEKQFPGNQMQAMTSSGAKGSSVNANLISCNLGQQVLEGRRVPLMVSGKSLPCFEPFDVDLRAGGFVRDRFLTGIRPPEYYFHHMAGREGLIDTAVKTSRSGYLQRCLIKGMEGLEVAYDSSVRDSDGTVVQFLYGEDGLDVSKQKYLFDFRFILENMRSQAARLDFVGHGDQAPFERRDEINKLMKKAAKAAGETWWLPDPVNLHLSPARFAYATSEKFFASMTDYIRRNAHMLIKQKKAGSEEEYGTNGDGGTEGARRAGSWTNRAQLSKKTAEKLLVAKYVRSLVEPGEAVGIVAGQSIGEPSTQMTLNTFHLAGHSARNVTLGIPRLREILMTASAKIATPTMTLVLNDDLSDQEGEQFARAISVLPLSHVLDRLSVSEHVGLGSGRVPARIYDIRLYFFPSAEYRQAYATDITSVLDAVERKFIPLLCALIQKALRQKAASGAATPEIGVKAGEVQMAVGGGGEDGPGGAQGSGNPVEDEDGEDEDGNGDEDATGAKQRANRAEAVSYGPNDDEDDAIQTGMVRLASPEPEDGDSDATGMETRRGATPASQAASEDDQDGDGHSSNRGGQQREREARVKAKNRYVNRFWCDGEKGEWCRLTLELDAASPKLLVLDLAQKAASSSLVRETAGIGKCSFVPDEKLGLGGASSAVATRVVHTTGANIRAMQQMRDYINPNRIVTNDVTAVLDAYGVEACRNCIIRELGGVFTVHGISVDSRHLSLVADYMTRNGGFAPFSRIGLQGNVSPFTKMSFETTIAFLRDAVMDGDWDDIRTPSSRLVMGRLGHVGTGAFGVLTRVPTHGMSGKLP